MVFFNRVILTLLLLAGSVLTAGPLQGAKPLYSKADLEILQQGRNFEEFFKHAKDIIPTQRDASWFNMVTDMAAQMVDDYRKTESYTNTHFNTLKELATWPELQRDEFFQVKRNAYTLEYLKRCLLKEEKVLCAKEMESFWKTARKDPELGYQILVLAEGFFPHGDHWTYLERTVTTNFSKFYCHKDLVHRAFDKKLLTIDLDIHQREQERKRLELMANRECWQQVSKHLHGVLLSGSAKDQNKVFDVLETLELLSPITRDAYLVKYFLEGPNSGRYLNLAWAALERLSQDYQQREKVLSELQTLDPLPGKIFGEFPKKRAKVLTDHLAKNFPEYIAKYSKTCVDYLTGTKIFPYGNPTVECHELFKQDSNRPLSQRMISQPLSIKYSGVMKSPQKLIKNKD